MYVFLLRDEILLEIYNETWRKVSNIIKKKFESKPLYNEEYLRKSHNGKINTSFQTNKPPKEGSQYICLSVILIDSIYRKDKNYYPQVFLEESKHVVKDKKASKFFTDDFLLMILINKILMKKILMKKIKYRNFF